MNIKVSGNVDLEKAMEGNRKRFFESRGISGDIFLPSLVHGNEVKIINRENCGRRLTGDGFLTNCRNLFLTVTVADCFPLYFYDPVRRVIGLAHAGWRGVGKNIVRNMVQAFANSFGSRPADIRLGIGPGIRQCHFVICRDKLSNLPPREIEVLNGLLAHKSFIEERRRELAIDLEGIIAYQARKEGIRQIEASAVCTYCAENAYFSYRRDGPPIKVMLACSGIG